MKANKGKPGVDGVTIEEFPELFRPQWISIRESLLDGSYQPTPLLWEEIPKLTGGMRPLGIPIVLDRVIQQAIAMVFGPIFDPGFSESSFGYRSERSFQDALRQVREYIRQGYRHVVDYDLSKFFDLVVQDVLMHRVAKRIRDKAGAGPDRYSLT